MAATKNAWVTACARRQKPLSWFPVLWVRPGCNLRCTNLPMTDVSININTHEIQKSFTETIKGESDIEGGWRVEKAGATIQVCSTGSCGTYTSRSVSVRRRRLWQHVDANDLFVMEALAHLFLHSRIPCLPEKPLAALSLLKY